MLKMLQFSYMLELKKGLDAQGHIMLEMPSGDFRIQARLTLNKWSKGKRALSEQAY